VDSHGRWKVTRKIWVVENVGVALGQVGDEVAQGDEVGEEKKVMAVDRMGTICLEGGEW
jgi:hypothetical protein